ncbi:hypothetical protein GCM10011491_40690 [Brucella endophytica]|uniref:DUF2793 domain-containing protein n=1 Tax=Brucella endophytica TaxID=1963359 RepID=A0A916SMQ2_9HYPH|nr:DUF2793 domain-containing protein [Brucella endophytica]GGB08536.1 hypothetical protein GCM10011491_40690 [Brucella endophytica]
MENTPNLKLPYILPSQAQKHVTHNEALQRLDTVVQLAVLDRDIATPPASPAEGARYIVAAGAASDWAGHEGKIACLLDGAWEFTAPAEGWIAWVADEGVLLAWDGSAWRAVSSGDGVTLEELADGTVKEIGINTATDVNNRLAVKADGVLFSHDDVTPGTGHMCATLNKADAAKDAGFVFQTNWSTRALFGTLGDNSFSLKVSPDGNSFNTGFNVRPDDGHVGLAGYTADANNDLGVKGTNVLFDRRANHMRININKNASANDASIGFQSGYSARALAGLLGNNNFTVKVSPDGTNYFTGLTVDGTNGVVSQNNLPRAVAGMNFNQTVPPGDAHLISLNSSISNPMNMFDPSRSRITVPVTGLYLVNYTGYFYVEAGTTIQTLQLYKNGAPTSPNAAAIGGGVYITLASSMGIPLNAGDFLELHGGSSGVQSVAMGSNFCFSVIYVGPSAV